MVTTFQKTFMKVQSNSKHKQSQIVFLNDIVMKLTNILIFKKKISSTSSNRLKKNSLIPKWLKHLYMNILLTQYLTLQTHHSTGKPEHITKYTVDFHCSQPTDQLLLGD